MVNVKLSWLVLPAEMVVGANDVEIVGGASAFTVSIALAVPPVPASLEVTGAVVFTLVPAVAPFTVNTMLQVWPAVSRTAVAVNVDGENDMEPPPVVSVPHVVPACAVTSVTPEGIVSLMTTFVNIVELGLVSEIVRVDDPPTSTVLGLNDLVTLGENGTAILPDVPVIDPLAVIVKLPDVLSFAVKLCVPESAGVNVKAPGKVAAVSVLVKFTVPAKLVTVFPYTSCAVTVNEKDAPGMTLAGADTANCVAGPGVTVILFDVPVIDEFTVSVAVMV